MERPIGEIFDFEGVKLEVVEKDGRYCEGCYFAGLVLCRIREIMGNTGYCGSANREDRKMVIFKKVQE